MSNLLHPKHRFGYNPTTGLIYDYVDGKDVPVSASYTASDGVWNLELVRDLILKGSTVETARIGDAPPKPAPAPKPGIVTKGLAFSPVQAAALGLTQAQLAAGLSTQDIANLKLTPARAIALNLNVEQKAYLGLGA